MDKNTTPEPVIQDGTGWHCNADGVPIHRNMLISQLRAIGYLGSVSVSVPALRTMHAEKLAAHAAEAQPAKKAKRTKAPVTDADALARSQKALERAAARKAAKEAPAAEVTPEPALAEAVA